MGEFTNTWHQNHDAVWKAVVLPRLPVTHRRWLELGSYEGQSAEWVLIHAMNPGDELVCVDGWWRPEVEKRFDANVGGRVTKHKGDSYWYLLSQQGRGASFSVIYVDADHDSRSTLESLVLAWRLLVDGGLMIVDDYRYNHPAQIPGVLRPALAIDAFLSCYSTDLSLLHLNWQAIIQKRDNVREKAYA